MKPYLFLLFFVSVSLSSHAAGPTVYQCPMHPWIRSEKAGDKCTICGMALVALPAGRETGAADPGLVTLSPAAASVVGVRSVEARRGSLVRTLRVSGVIDDDDTRHRVLGARVPGRVEKLFVNYVGAEVRAGEPLATFYSPEMLTAQRQYVERVRAGAIAFSASERAAARERLLELGLTEEEIDILEHTLEPTAMVTVRSPMSGTVVARYVYEGQELNKDQSEKETRLFEIGDFSTMWFVFDVYEPDLAWVRPGQEVEIATASLGGRTESAPITFVDPTLDAMTRTARARVVLANSDHRFFHRQTATGQVRLEIPDVLTVPRTAVLQHGAEPIVFLEQGDRSYLARRVKPGRVGDADVEILAGLQVGDRVVVQGGLLLDGQAQLAQAAISGEPRAELPVQTAPGPESPKIEAGDAELRELAFAAADAAAVLAQDDWAGYQKQLPNLRRALQAYLAADPSGGRGPLETIEDGLRDRPDLRTARRDFEVFSTAVTDLARGRGVTRRAGLHAFECPMAPVHGIGRWLGRSRDVRNPFFGSAMLVCGEELK